MSRAVTGAKVRLNVDGAKALQRCAGCMGHESMVEGLVGTVVASSGFYARVRFDDHAFPTNGSEGSVGWVLSHEQYDIVVDEPKPLPPLFGTLLNMVKRDSERFGTVLASAAEIEKYFGLTKAMDYVDKAVGRA